MRSSFTTQTIEEKPKVFLLGSSDQLSLIVNHLFSSSGFDLVFFNLENTDLETLKQILQQRELEFYKIILVNVASKLEKELCLSLVSLLQKRSEPLLYVMNYSRLESRSLFAVKKQLLFIKKNQQNLIIQDLFFSTELLSPWLELFSQFKKNIFLDPQTSLFPCGGEGLKKILEKLLFVPVANKTILIRGEEILSNSLLQDFKSYCERFFDHNFTVKNAAYLLQALDEPEHQELLSVDTPKSERESFLLAAIKEHKIIALRSQEESGIVSTKTKILKPVIPIIAPNNPEKYLPKSKKLIKTNTNQEGEIGGHKDRVGQQEIEAEIASIFKTDRIEQKTKKVVKKIKKNKIISAKQKRKKMVFFSSLFIFGIAVGMTFLLGLFALTNKLQQHLLKQELAKIETGSYFESSGSQTKTLKRVSSLLSLQYAAYSPFLSKTWMSGIDQNLDLFRYLSEYKEIYQRKQYADQAIFSYVFSLNAGDQTINLEQLLKKSRSASEELITSLSNFQLRLESKKNFGSQADQDLEQLLFDQKKQIQVNLQLLDTLPDLLGSNTNKNYLLLLENNMELTASGGMIEAVALLSFNNGKLVNYQIYDSAQLEDKIKGNRAAPADFQEVFGRNTLLAQESSWFMNFPQAAQGLSTEAETAFGQSIDGVVAINLSSIEIILKNIDTLDLPVYNESLNQTNLFEKIYLRAGADLDAKLGKQSYFATLLSALVEKIVKTPQSFSLLKLVPNMAKEKQILFFLADTDYFNRLAWTGAVAEPHCPQPFEQECQIDSLFQTETNIGANYVNRFVSRSTQHLITVGENYVTHTRQISFKNNATSNSWPGGTYRSYVQFAVPSTAIFEGMTVSGKLVPDAAILRSQQNGKTTWGTILELQPQEEKQLTLEFRVPTKNQRSYGFFDQKQAGMAATPLLLDIHYSPTLSPSIISPQAKVFGSTLEFSSSLESDSLFMAQFK